MTLVVEVDDLQTQLLADELVEIADGLTTDLRGGNEAAHAEVDEHAALDDLRDGRFDHLILLVRFDDFFPRLESARATFGQVQLTVLVVDPVDHDFQSVADLQFFGLDRERELAERQNTLGLAADVDEKLVLILRDDDAGENLTFIEDLEALFVQALLERELILFFVDRRRRSDGGGNVE